MGSVYDSQMEELCIDGFLDSARAVGIQDSEGAFTISHAQAVQKMARYSLPYPEAWILKIVQAAVIWRASEIKVAQTRLYTTIEFCPGEKKDIPTEQDVVSTLLGRSGAGTVPVGKLCLGLRTLVRTEDYSFILTLNTGRTEVRPLYAGREAQTLTKLDRLQLARRQTAGIKIVVIHLRKAEHLAGRLLYRFLPWWRRDRLIAFELQRSASVCSIPIQLNRRVLTSLSDSALGGSKRDWRFLLSGGLHQSGEPPLTLAAETQNNSAWYLGHACTRAIRSREPLRPRDKTHQVHWVCEGVVVQTDTFTHPTHLLKLTILMNAESLQTDITGLLLQDSEAKSARWRSLFPILTAKLGTEAERSDFALDPANEKLWEQDLRSFSDRQVPTLERQARGPGTRRYSSASDYGVLRTQTGKYVSEVVTSSDGKSHLIIKTL